jgi:hypothetical protein
MLKFPHHIQIKHNGSLHHLQNKKTVELFIKAEWLSQLIADISSKKPWIHDETRNSGGNGDILRMMLGCLLACYHTKFFWV